MAVDELWHFLFASRLISVIYDPTRSASGLRGVERRDITEGNSLGPMYYPSIRLNGQRERDTQEASVTASHWRMATAEVTCYGFPLPDSTDDG
jgi:hypothetical protein